MKLLSLLALLDWTYSFNMSPRRNFGDLDLNDNLNEDDFLDEFGLPVITGDLEKERRQIALKDNEEIVKRQNIDFINGKKLWWDKIDKMSDLPEDEFVREKTGVRRDYSRGILPCTGSDCHDERSEKYFDKFRYSRAVIPSQYNAVDQGLISPAKDQLSCASCGAFSTVALIETCFKKVTGIFGDYSEQQLVDCAVGYHKARGCKGARTYSYARWAVENHWNLTDEISYPYLNDRPKYTCPENIQSFNQGARLSNYYYTYKGNEELLKRLVFEHGAVQTTVEAKSLKNYGGGIIKGCLNDTKKDPDCKINHAIVVVGYGTDEGTDFWLIKNSWGEDWGEKGFARLRRGFGDSGLGKSLLAVTCQKVGGPTDLPPTTLEVCADEYESGCDVLAELNCKKYGKHCKKSCGLCEGMKPLPSNACADTRLECSEIANDLCWNREYKVECCRSCGLGDEMTPAASNTCFDKWGKRCSTGGAFKARGLCSKFPDECKKSCGFC